MADELRDLMGAVLPRVEEYVSETTQNGKIGLASPDVVNFLPPDKLRSKLDLTLPDTSPPSSKDAQTAVLQAVDDLLSYSVRTAHSRFWNRLYTGSDPVGQVAEFLTAVLNTSPDTYAVAPVLTLIHETIIDELAQRFGFHPRGSASGIFTPGGSSANLTAMTVARNTLIPHSRNKGLCPHNGTTPRQPIIFTSEHAHFSIPRAAMLLGIGETHGCRRLPCDEYGRLDVATLADAVRASKASASETPFMVCVTAGTTVFGAFDPVERVAEVCREYGLWLHLDAAWGGAVVFSERHREMLEGARWADSVAFNPHKMLGVPLQCSVLLTRQRGVLERALSSRAEYLYHDEMDDPAASFDIGDRSLQCGRRADLIKLWLSWKRHGAEGFGARVDHAIDLIQSMRDLIVRRSSDFQLVCEPSFANVCFWLLPTDVPDCDSGCPLLDNLNRTKACIRACTEENCATCPLYEETTTRVHREMHTSGKLMINFSSLPGVPAFFRFVAGSPKANVSDLSFALDHMICLRNDLRSSHDRGISSNG